MSTLRLNTDLAIAELTGFLAEQIGKAGFSRAVVGLSGGIDSAVSAALAARALGPGSVWAVMMPHASSNPASLADAREVVEATGVHGVLEEITPQIDAYYLHHPDADRVRRGNKMARERMSILYDYSKKLEALVVGTGNRTEYLLGYTTMYGDNACAINPLGKLLKTHVRQLARALELPERVITKPPSADLWAGQTDEEELGITYEAADRLLSARFDRGLKRDELLAEGFPAEQVDFVERTFAATAFKRRLPAVAPLSPEALGA